MTSAPRSLYLKSWKELGEASVPHAIGASTPGAVMDAGTASSIRKTAFVAPRIITTAAKITARAAATATSAGTGRAIVPVSDAPSSAGGADASGAYGGRRGYRRKGWA